MGIPLQGAALAYGGAPDGRTFTTTGDPWSGKVRVRLGTGTDPGQYAFVDGLPAPKYVIGVIDAASSPTTLGPYDFIYNVEGTLHQLSPDQLYPNLVPQGLPSYNPQWNKVSFFGVVRNLAFANAYVGGVGLRLYRQDVDGYGNLLSTYTPVTKVTEAGPVSFITGVSSTCPNYQGYVGSWGLHFTYKPSYYLIVVTTLGPWGGAPVFINGWVPAGAYAVPGIMALRVAYSDSPEMIVVPVTGPAYVPVCP